MKRIRLVHVVVGSLVIGTAVAAFFYGPLLPSIWRAHLYDHRAGPPELQRIIERANGPVSADVAANARAFPYESVSLETGPCFGRCPIYTFTLYRDGHARLVTDDRQPQRRKTYTGTISPLDYARITQLVFLARAAAHEPHYAGDWTDDAEVVVRATASGTAWEVSDYGGVSPPEVWALIQVLRSYKTRIDWQAAPGD